MIFYIPNVTSLQCCYIFFWYFGIIEFSTFKCLELNTAQAVARAYPSCTDSIKPSLKHFFPDIYAELKRFYRYLYIE
jgi:hypothetical protein